MVLQKNRGKEEMVQLKLIKMLTDKFCVTLKGSGGGCLSEEEADDACETEGAVFCYDECCREGEVSKGDKRQLSP